MGRAGKMAAVKREDYSALAPKKYSSTGILVKPVTVKFYKTRDGQVRNVPVTDP